ncbi:MAG TPA: HDOD domain-containing protein [Terriglobales bacterium]|nr:HDOD domain-containing protein [Terriglobales bacterium]
MPGAVLLLELRLASNVADLNAVTGLIRKDVGLTVELLRLAFGEPRRRRASSWSVAELAVDLGLEKLRAMAAGTTLLACQAPGKAAFQACQAFWRRARQTAQIAEELAGGQSATIQETAYVAGLLCHVGMLPRLLGWPVSGIDSADPAEVGFHMTKAWNFPALLVEVIRGDGEACTSPQARSLLQLINTADRQASHGPMVTAAEVGDGTQSWS